MRCSFSRGVRSSSSFSACARSFASAARSRRDPHQRVRRLARLEPRIPVDGSRNFEHGLAPPGSLRVKQPFDAVEPPAGNSGERRRLVLGKLRSARRDLVAHGRVGEPPERDELTARANRLRQRAEVVGHEHRGRVRRRLLEILQQGVGCLVVERVRAEDEVDAAVGLERPHVEVAPELPDRVDPDLVAERLEHIEVGMRTALDPARVAEEHAGEPERGAALPHSGRPVEEVRVRRALGEGGVEQPARFGLLRKALEACHAPPSRRPRPTGTRRA